MLFYSLKMSASSGGDIRNSFGKRGTAPLALDLDELHELYNDADDFDETAAIEAAALRAGKHFAAASGSGGASVSGKPGSSSEAKSARAEEAFGSESLLFTGDLESLFKVDKIAHTAQCFLCYDTVRIDKNFTTALSQHLNGKKHSGVSSHSAGPAYSLYHRDPYPLAVLCDGKWAPTVLLK